MQKLHERSSPTFTTPTAWCRARRGSIGYLHEGLAKKAEVRSSIAPLLVRSPEDVPSCLLQRTSGEMTQEHAQRSFNRFAEQSVDRKAADRRGLPNNVRYADVGFPSRPCFRSVALSRNARPDGSSPSIVRARN
jgi:hypothetical protein